MTAVNEIKEYFAEFNRRFRAQKVFDDFCSQVKAGIIQNDGTNTLLSLVDHYVLDKSSSRFREVLPTGSTVYRARKADIHKLPKVSTDASLTGYPEGGSREAPLGNPGAGRGNTSGISYFYAADRESTACAEIKPGIKDFVSVARFETKAPLELVDFSRDTTFPESEDEVNLGTLFTLVMLEYTRPVKNEDEYKASQFLTDYIRKTGVDGVCYASSFDDGGRNYVIFNSSRANLEFMGSRLVLRQRQSLEFLDFENKGTMSSHSSGFDGYDPEFAKELEQRVHIALLHNADNKVESRG